MVPSVRCPQCGRPILLLDWQDPNRWEGTLCTICRNAPAKTRAEKPARVDRWEPRPTMKCAPVAEPGNLPEAPKTVNEN